jgi:hypothetical protein
MGMIGLRPGRRVDGKIARVSERVYYLYILAGEFAAGRRLRGGVGRGLIRSARRAAKAHSQEWPRYADGTTVWIAERSNTSFFSRRAWACL